MTKFVFSNHNPASTTTTRETREFLIIHGLSHCHCISCLCDTARECYFDCICEYCPHYNSTEK